MKPHPIIIDADPGDDAIAILLALASPELDVLGVTAVAGNVPLALTCRNALALLELAGRTDIPVAAGAGRPLLRPLVTAEEVHGENGLGGVVLPEPSTVPDRRHAADFILETVATHPPGTVTLCCLGPLHDPCVIARLVRPGLFRSKRVAVTVETGSELTMGLTVMDWWGVTGRPANATVLHEVDADGFFALLAERLGRL